jgi:hypothetical protein
MRYLGLILLFAGMAAHAQNIETLWRARGLEAFDHIKKLRDDKSKISECKIIIEAAFGLLADIKTSSALIKKTEPGTAITLFLKAEKSGHAWLSFSYGKSSTKPNLVRLSPSSSGWTLVVIPGGGDGLFGISNSDCLYVFNPNDYLHPEVELTKKSKT